MPKYVIEREIPGAGKLSPDQLQGISQTSCGVLRQMDRRCNGWRAPSPTTRFTVHRA
jgi:hypothetical protein